MKRYCYNCGKSNHTYSNCMAPIMSYGFVLYRVRDNKLYYLMIQRNYTPDFKELIRGKFDMEDPDYIHNLISRITLHEINYINNYPHKILYQNIEKYYKVRKNKLYHDKYKKAKENYKNLLQGFQNSSLKLIKFSNIVRKNNPTYYLEPDWGFPKGRRNYRGNETDLECAIRELKEETNITPDSYDILPRYNVMEVYEGTNKIKYAHKYYVGKCNDNIIYYIDPFNKHQVGEIRKIGWYSFEESSAMIRPYHEEKRKVLIKIHHMLLGHENLT